MPKRLGLGLLGMLFVLLAIVVVRTLALGSGPSEGAPAEAAREAEVDVDGAVARLAEGLRFETISHGGGKPVPADAFFALHAHLERSYPLTHASLRRETVSQYSLLYTWPGSDASLEPALLMAHQDVVPVDAGEWTYPPFGGDVKDGMLWGRGAIDDKGSLYMILEAVESLLAAGFTPERTILLFFGHDEEVGGPEGAVPMAERLEAEGVDLAWVLDEGGFVVEGIVPGMDAPIALVGVAEKGSVTYRLRLEMAGGHSSVPPRHTAIGVMAEAITKIEANPMPGGIDDLTRTTLESLAPSMPFAIRAVLANLWLFGPAVEMAISGSPPMDAMQRTTTAVTIIDGGVKSNVLPSRVEATVNFRIRPGDDAQKVKEHLRRVIDDDRIEILDPEGSREASAVSNTDSEAFALLSRTIGEVFPGVPVVPYVVVGGTDSRQFYRVTSDVYRFNPFRFGPNSAALPHGTDERVPIASLPEAIRFYRTLIESSGG